MQELRLNYQKNIHLARKKYIRKLSFLVYSINFFIFVDTNKYANLL
jgi:hypothetical protein